MPLFRRMSHGLFVLLLIVSVAGCDMLGIESATATSERKEAEGKAIGSACRHATRAIEDCYTLYPKAVKAAVYGGWREMDEYMRENKLEGIAPVIPRKVPGAAIAASAPASDADPHGNSGDKEGFDKAGEGKSADTSRKPAKGAHPKTEH